MLTSDIIVISMNIKNNKIVLQIKKKIITCSHNYTLNNKSKIRAYQSIELFVEKLNVYHITH